MRSELLSPQYKKALDLVAVLFRDIRRKDGEIPYIVHLVGVSHIVARATDDEAVHIAGLLHDTIEDIPPEIYSEAMMRQDFGDKITEIVKTVSHDIPQYGKEEAHRRYLEQITNGPLEACLVSAADMLYNSLDMIQMYQENPELMKQKFGGHKVPGRLQFWGERLRILTERLGNDNVIIKELTPIWEQLTAIHREIQ